MGAALCCLISFGTRKIQVIQEYHQIFVYQKFRANIFYLFMLKLAALVLVEGYLFNKSPVPKLQLQNSAA